MQRAAYRHISSVLAGVSVLAFIHLAPLSRPATASAEAGSELEQQDQDLLQKEEQLLKQLGADHNTTEVREPKKKREKRSPARAEEPKAAAVSAPQPSAEQKHEQELALLKKDLEDKETRIQNLVQELSTTRNRLLLAETEVERLSAIVQERNKRQLASFAPQLGKSPARERAVPTSPRAALAADRVVAESDMRIATVVTEKANLRTGPGANNSPLMTVSRGTRLAVETRNGDWYRVISPAGTRAWVSSDVVVFGEPAGVARNSRMGGYDSKADERAFDFISQRAQ